MGLSPIGSNWLQDVLIAVAVPFKSLCILGLVFNALLRINLATQIAGVSVHSVRTCSRPFLANLARAKFLAILSSISSLEMHFNSGAECFGNVSSHNLDMKLKCAEVPLPITNVQSD